MVSDIPAGDGKNYNLFYSVVCLRRNFDRVERQKNHYLQCLDNKKTRRHYSHVFNKIRHCTLQTVSEIYVHPKGFFILIVL
jgi:hypothetical protein